MSMKPILAIAAALFLVAPAPAATPNVPVVPSPYFIKLDLVEQIICADRTGSGARIDGDLVLTAEHVIEGGPCTIGGALVEVVHVDRKADMAVLRTARRSFTRIALSCAPFREGRAYYAIGYAFGSDFVVQRLMGTKSKTPEGRWQGQALLRGQVFHGMSGGPIVDENGGLVGIINAVSKSGVALSVSKPLAETYLCREE